MWFELGGILVAEFLIGFRVVEIDCVFVLSFPIKPNVIPTFS